MSKPAHQTPGDAPYNEIAALVRQLHETQRRLQELGGGELDAVLHPAGQSYLLHDAQERLRRSETLQRDLAASQSAILNALPAHVALLDRAGVILSVNEGWKEYGRRNGLGKEAFGVGCNYLEVCGNVFGDYAGDAIKAAAGIRAVLQGEARGFAMEYPCHPPMQPGWYRLMANAMAADGSGGGAVVMHVDITDRKAAQQDLAANEALLSQFIRYAPAAIAMLDTQMRYIQTSDRWIHDYRLDGASLTGRRHYDVFPDLPERWKEMHRRVLAGGVERCEEDPFPRNDGSMDWLQWEARPWHKSGGQIGGLIFFTQVITGRKRAETSLSESQQRLSLATKSARIGIWDWDIAANHMVWDERMIALYGIRAEAFSGAVDAWQNGLHPDDRARAEAELAAALAGARDFNSEFRVVWPNGELHHIEAHASVVRAPDGAAQRMIGVNWDVTERKRTEARFRRLIDSDVQGIVFWNAKGEITESNDAFLNLVGYTREDLERGRINWMAMTPPEFAGADRKALAEIAAAGVCAHYEKELIRRDGSRVCLLLGSAIFDDNPEEGVCFMIDLTERKKLEHQILRAQRMESIGTLAGGIAHDLNNTLSPIIMSLDILATKFTDPDSANLLEILGASARRGANMVRQVLSFARGVEGERKEMQLKHLVHEIENIVRDTFPKNIRLSSGVPSDLWTILGDATQLHQVLLNLCVNARDAMPGGGKIIVSAENLLLDEHAAGMNPDALPGPYICLEVADNGAGIEPAVIDRIFEPFFTTKDIDKGTGLGLSTTAAIVKSHGGFLRVFSEVGKGTQFRIYLPGRREGAHDASAEREVELPGGHQELILVVDDEETVRIITQRTLQAFGYRAITATDGADALAQYATHREEIAVVLTDLMMPVMDGPALIQVLRRLDANLLIVAVSGLAGKEHLDRLASMGVRHFLPKPYTAATLLKTLEELLAERAV